MPGLFDGTPLERPVTCERCEAPLNTCRCPRNADGDLTLPKDQPVRVRREKRRGKHVTVIAGLDPSASNLNTLLKEFRTALGVGGTIKNDQIELQGDNRDAVINRLKSLGYPAKPAGG